MDTATGTPAAFMTTAFDADESEKATALAKCDSKK